MDAKKRNRLYTICSIVGLTAMLVWLILMCTYTLVIGIIFAGIAVIAFAIQLGVQISSKENCVSSIVMIIIILIAILNTARCLG